MTDLSGLWPEIGQADTQLEEDEDYIAMQEVNS